MAESRGLRTRKFLVVFDKFEDFRSTVSARYPKEVELITNFRMRSGDQCNFVRAAVERVHSLERDRVGPAFQQDISARYAAAGKEPA